MKRRASATQEEKENHLYAQLSETPLTQASAETFEKYLKKNATVLVTLWLRLSKDPSKSKEFQNLQRIIKSPTLMLPMAKSIHHLIRAFQSTSKNHLTAEDIASLNQIFSQQETLSFIATPSPNNLIELVALLQKYQTHNIKNELEAMHEILESDPVKSQVCTLENIRALVAHYIQCKNDPSKSEEFQQLKNIVISHQMILFLSGKVARPALLALYRESRRNQDTETLNTLESIFKAPELDKFWPTSRKTKGVPYRFGTQEDSEPDIIHPFDLHIGSYYKLLIQSRMLMIDGYIRCRNRITLFDFSLAIEALQAGFQGFYNNEMEAALKAGKVDIPQADQDAKKILEEQIANLSKLESQLKPIAQKLRSETKLSKAENETYKKAGAAFKIISELMETNVIPAQRYDIQEGLEHNNFFAFWVGQTMDDLRLNMLAVENRLLNEKWDYDENDPSKESNYFTQEALDLMTQIECRFQSHRDIFIYPSYLMTAHMYLAQSERYIDISMRLLKKISNNGLSRLRVNETTLMKLSMYFNNEPGFKWTEKEILLLQTIRCMQKAYMLQQKSLSYAIAAKELKESGNYNIIESTVSPKDIEHMFQFRGSDEQSKTFDDFIEALSIKNERAWKDAEVSFNEIIAMNGINLLKQKAADHTSCKAEVDSILQRHLVESHHEELPQFS